MKNPEFWGLWGEQKESIPFRKTISWARLCSNITMLMWRVSLIPSLPTYLLLTIYGRATQEKERDGGRNQPSRTEFLVPPECLRLKGNDW